jgi:hypothetical protein
MTYNKLVLLHQYVENEINLISSFKDDSKIIQTNNETKLQDILGQIQEFKSDGKYPFNHLAFVYHFPGYHSVPFLETIKEDSSGNLLDNKYYYFNDEIIDLIKELGSGLTVDLLSCDLKDDNFKEEVAKIENDLNINIRYSVDQTGNNPQGNWVLESDNVDVKDLYFSETIDEWNGVLNSGRTITSDSNYFKIDGNTIKLKGNFTWSEITNNLGWDTTDYITLGDGQSFDGQGHTIDLESNIIAGLFASTGTTIDNGPVLKNLGVLGGQTYYINNNNYNNSGSGFIIIKNQSYFKVDNCYSTGNINKHGGGICGNRCTIFRITRCYSTGNIEGTGSGGITSYKCIGDISNCYSTGDIIGEGAGGIGGGDQGNSGTTNSTKGTSNIHNCYSTGNIEGTGSGGICGAYTAPFEGEVEINNCYSTGDISGTNSGGIIGIGAGHKYGIVKIDKCYSIGTISGTNSGGITGNYTNSGVQINNCYSNGTITGTGDTITGSNNSLNGNYPLSDISNNSRIGNLGDKYTISFLNNYKYPVLKSNLGAGLITSTDTYISLNRTVNFDVLQTALNHNSTFTHFVPRPNQSITINGNYIILNNNSNIDILSNKNILDIDNLNTAYSLSELSTAYSPSELKEYYPLSQLIDEYSFLQLKTAYSLSELEEYYSFSDLKTVYSPSELKTIFSLSLSELKELYSALELKNDGFKNHKILQAGYSASELLNSQTFTLEELRANNYSIADIKGAAITRTAQQYRDAGYPESQITENNISE